MSAANTTNPRRLRALAASVPSWVQALLVSAGLAGATWALFSRAFLNYDTLYALIWGRDLAQGQTPDFEFTLAPTPHPLATAVGALASLFGTDGGYTVMLAVALLSFGVLLWAIFRLGQVAFAWPVGLLAALVVATRVPFLSQGVRAYVDIPFLALVVLAAVLEVQRPRRGWPVLGLLALAGLVEAGGVAPGRGVLALSRSGARPRAEARGSGSCRGGAAASGLSATWSRPGTPFTR